MPQIEWQIYSLSDPQTQQIRYVGMTTRGKRRYIQHLSDARKNGSTYCDRWIRKLLTNGMHPIHTVVDRGKKRGPFSVDTRIKMSEAHRGIPLSIEHRVRIAEALRGRVFSDEHKAKLSAVQRGKKRGPMSEMQKAKLSVIHKARWGKQKQEMKNE